MFFFQSCRAFEKMYKQKKIYKNVCIYVVDILDCLSACNMLLLLVAWVFCASSIAAAWAWLRSHSRYEVLEPEESVRHRQYQHRVMKAAMMLCTFSLVFLTLHFIFVQTERQVENELKTATKNATLDSLHSLENYLEGEANETAGAMIDGSGGV